MKNKRQELQQRILRIRDVEALGKGRGRIIEDTGPADWFSDNKMY